jgi:hypothetical protein
MEALQEQLLAVQQERDDTQANNVQAVADRAASQEQAAQAMVDLAAAQAAAGGPAGPVTFSLSPALATNALINYVTGEGIKLYGRATAPLDALFNGDYASLRLFLTSKVQQRATQSGWTDILQISKQTG